MSEDDLQITTADMLEIVADSDNVAEYPDIRGLIEEAAKELRKKDEEISNLREALKPLAAMDVELLDENKKPTGIHAFDTWDQNQVVFDIGKDRKIIVADLRRARALLDGENR